MKQLCFIAIALLFSWSNNAQIIVIDPGHGYGTSTSENPDGRTTIEIETALEVGIKTKALIQATCNWTAHLTRNSNLNGWISVNQRALMANSWNADRLLSIHCNAGGGTGTETFYCTDTDTNTGPDISFAQKIQASMVTQGLWNNRRCVEDYSYLTYHLGVLKYSAATACLNEIGFVDSQDASKLTNASWRDHFAMAYLNALKSSLNVSCDKLPGDFTMSVVSECTPTSQLRLIWTNATNATSYDIYRNGTLYASDITGNQFVNSYLISAATSYSYSVKAKNTIGTTTNSNGLQSITAARCPPTAFTLSALSDCTGNTSRITLNWTASSNATSYDIYRNGNLYARDLTTTQFINTYQIVAGSAYTYMIKAKNSVGLQSNSNGRVNVIAISCNSPSTFKDSEINENNPIDVLLLYPNPTTGICYIDLKGLRSKWITYEILNYNGKKLLQKQSLLPYVSNKIDISHYPNGLYLVKIFIDGQYVIKRVFKN